MPRASANISAKFIAQIEIGMICVPRYSSPAAASSPTIVSISGRPAATSEPNASSMMPSVTGQEMTSDLSIADRLAALKSDHIPAAPVRLTTTALVESPWRVPFSLSAAATISLGFLAAPAWTIAVWPSGETDIPGSGSNDGPHRAV